MKKEKKEKKKNEREREREKNKENKKKKDDKKSRQYLTNGLFLFTWFGSCSGVCFVLFFNPLSIYHRAKSETKKKTKITWVSSTKCASIKQHKNSPPCCYWL